jgi:hypothetical protein
MKKFLYIPLFYYFFFSTKMVSFWSEDVWIFDGSWLTKEKLRTWDVHVDNIPGIIRAVIDYLMWIAWTISVIFIIIWAYQMLFWSLEWSNNKWKDTIIMALTWFAIAALSWFIVKLVFDNFS